MKNQNKYYWRTISVGLLGCLFILIAVVFKKMGWEIPFNLLVMFGGLMFAKIVVERITKERFA